MLLYEDNHPHSSRAIWVNYIESNHTLSFALQDLGDDFESEEVMSGIPLDKMLKALQLSDIEELFALLKDNYSTVDAMDRIQEDILRKYGIEVEHYTSLS